MRSKGSPPRVSSKEGSIFVLDSKPGETDDVGENSAQTLTLLPSKLKVQLSIDTLIEV